VEQPKKVGIQITAFFFADVPKYQIAGLPV
jgi:hypothetical protein